MLKHLNYRKIGIMRMALAVSVIFVGGIFAGYAGTFGFDRSDVVIPLHQSGAVGIFDSSHTESGFVGTEDTNVCYFDMRGKFTVSDSCKIGEDLEVCGESSDIVCTVDAKGECTAKEGDYALYFVRKPSDGKSCPGHYPSE